MQGRMIIKTEILCQFVGRDSFSASRRRWQKRLVLEAAQGKGISEMRLRMAGFFLEGREAGFAMLHFFKSSCCRNYFLFSFRVFCKDYKHCREQR